MTDTTGWQSRADDAIGSVASAVAAAQQRAAAAARLRTQLDDVRGRGISRYGEVEAVTDATGRVVDLRFAEKALDLSAADLTRVTLDAIGAARRRSGAAAVGLARQAWGDGSPTVALLAAELGHRMDDDAEETHLLESMRHLGTLLESLRGLMRRAGSLYDDLLHGAGRTAHVAADVPADLAHGATRSALPDISDLPHPRDGADVGTWTTRSPG